MDEWLGGSCLILLSEWNIIAVEDHIHVSAFSTKRGHPITFLSRGKTKNIYLL